MPVDTSQWPTKDEARQELGGLSLSALNNLIKNKRLEVRLRKRPNQVPIGVINPADLEREKDLRSQLKGQPVPDVVIAPAARPIASTKPPNDTAELMRAAVALAVANQARSSAAPVVPPDRMYLTIEEAVQLTGLGQFYIEQHVQGQPIGPRRAVVYRRSDLEKL